MYVEKEVVVEKIVPGPTPDPVIVTNEVEVEVETEADPTSAIVAVIVVIVIIIGLNLILCHFCIRRHKRRIETLETEKVDWSEKKQRRR